MVVVVVSRHGGGGHSVRLSCVRNDVYFVTMSDRLTDASGRSSTRASSLSFGAKLLTMTSETTSHTQHSLASPHSIVSFRPGNLAITRERKSCQMNYGSMKPTQFMSCPSR